MPTGPANDQDGWEGKGTGDIEPITDRFNEDLKERILGSDDEKDDGGKQDDGGEK